jgi:hypothetical protein
MHVHDLILVLLMRKITLRAGFLSCLRKYQVNTQTGTEIWETACETAAEKRRELLLTKETIISFEFYTKSAML